MKEYSIFIKNGNGLPYMLDSYKNIESAKFAVYNIVSLEEERGRQYFVDNDYFDNKYHFVGNLKYICIKERDVTNWSNYSEYSRNNKNIFYLNKI